jgi:predicted transglutaminase-like cysteine proteinase
MVAFVRRPLLAGSLALIALAAGAADLAFGNGMTMRVNGWANPPIGYVDFCKSFPAECAIRGGGDVGTLDERRWRDLQEINTLVNRIVIPATDLEYYQREEVWTLPQSYGDCEDYVLLKRKWLLERGWSSGSLLVTVVFDEIGDGHAVLLARTNGGDFVLDNKTDDIRAWQDTAYRFVKRQSASDPNRWVSVGDPRWTTHNTAAPR